jgi:4-hydroxybenzoate polyprenyltransferase
MINQGKALALLQLMRLPNLFTAMADVMAGYLLVAGMQIHVPTLLSLLLTTSAIYAGGCVLNDLCDREIDQRERPQRPIPSGKVLLREAGFLTFFLFAMGLTCAALAGSRPFFMAVILIVLVIAYDWQTKDILILGSLNMGSCRAGNLLLGMSPLLNMETLSYFPLISLGYVFFLTSLSNFETGGRLGWLRWVIVSGLLLLFISLLGNNLFGTLRIDGLLYLLLMAFFIQGPVRLALLQQTPALIGQAIKRLILAIPFLDAVYVAGTHGFLYGIPVVFCLIPAWLLAKKLAVT